MLRGRGTEQAEIEALLGSARAGVSGALVLRGEPGIGKTALLREAVADAAGMRVLRSAGIESEAELPFAGLHQLLRGELHRLGALPAPQRRALSGAFGLGDAVGDRFMVGAGVLSLLAEVAEESPVLCVVDDAHWLDRASAEALLFAARRLDREGVAVLLAVRDYAEALTGSGLPELHLSGLDDESAAALLDERLPAELRARLLTETRGNPLALRELPSVVAGHGPGPLPLTARVLDAFHHRIRSLPGATRTLLLLAAADDSGEPAAILRAGERLGVGVAELGPAEEQRLVTNELAFRHPLIRAAVYHGAPLVQRIAAHEALAAAYAARGDEDREAWHRAVAAPGADEQVADKLARTARRAEERHAYAAAASAYERAAQLSETSVAAALRLTSACEAAIHNGRFDWARSRAERVLPDVGDGPTRARLAEVRAAADFAQGSLSSAHKLLLEHAPLTPEPERAFWMVLRALHAGWAAPDGAPLLAAALDGFDALALAPDHPLRSVAWLARWGAAPGLGWDTAGYPDLDDVLDRARVAAREAGPRGLMEVASRSFVVGRDDVSCEVSAELAGTARDTGMPFALAPGLGHLTLTQVLLGRHRDALISGDEGLRIARDTGQPLWTSYVHGALAYLAAVEGDESRSREHAEAAGAGQVGSAWAQTALALLDLGHGRLRDAFDRLRDLAGGPRRHQGAVLRSTPDLVEAAVRLGRADEVSVAEFASWAAALRVPWLDALVARCRALLAPENEAEQHYRRALEPAGRPFDRARTELLYGEWLRRGRRKTEARSQLRSALRTFEELGSGPWAERARTELGAAGEAVAQAARPDVFAALTPQELQITRFAAQGLSNRDIAARLYLSPRTVAYHLYKAYPKLGVTSRAELGGLGVSGV
ncbi:DNA-binding CsgD family transcriptional regulator [Amycolatopsis bartoniae]|uniref:Helix-turn-helix transcriptional regulator n=1 Tax=Amycolatopsis bartoniae TaxID=941986 RepID=A0A8H9IQE1_9PSEU|nr:LuxR family transcriptional regulator [Amycolatopsis bartoniae]MBB2938146.1 DNA-binding CsgD family transcriptional regulator [Amycolatopsis bartoniae]TVT03247.1 AAA family ATPase [Amycolatopsis bartoniae]GHF32996.1 helix-turn-helix transcriptional regulator [Amycolatopsis bartoniae]